MSIKQVWRSRWNTRALAFLALTVLATGVGAAATIGTAASAMATHTGGAQPGLLTLFGLLLVGGAVASGFLMARSIAGARETTMRAALGISRARFAAYYVARSLPIAFIGAAVNVALTFVLAPRIVPMIAGSLGMEGVVVDWTRVLLAAGTAVVVSVCVALTPIWRALRPNEQPVVPLGTLIGEFTDSVRRAASVREATDASLAVLRERTGASSIMLLEKVGKQYRNQTCAIPANGVLLNRLRSYRHALAVPQFDTWLRWARESKPEHVAEIETLAATGVQTAVPLRAKKEIVGVLLLGPPVDREQYTATERKVVSHSAEVLALMLENARLTEREVEQEALRRDLAMAAEVQKRLLPPRPPRSSVATFAAFTMPARTLGGDYYDFLDLGDERIGMAVADVSGKGVPAALLMSVVQASLRVISTERDLPVSQLAEKMNGFLHQSTEGNKYATFFYAQIEEQGRRLRYVNAGHNPPYLVRRSEESVDIVELRTGGTVLGLFPDVTYEEGCVDLQPGDVLVTFTDGVPDALNPKGEEFGEERLKDVVHGTVGASASDISTRLAETMSEWIGDAEQHDDLTCVVVSLKELRG